MFAQFVKMGSGTTPPFYISEGALSDPWLASARLLMAGIHSCSVIATSTWRWFLWPVAALPDELEPVNSSKIHFTLTGERFPIDLIGSYDVDRAKSIIANAPRTSIPADVEFWRAYADQMKSQHFTTAPHSTVDCSIPPIIVTVDKAGGRYMLIDGWHRVEKASAEGRDVIQAFYLTEEETKNVFDVAGGPRTKGSFD
jgi:hypothetical protein